MCYCHYKQELRELQDEHERRLAEKGHEILEKRGEAEKRRTRIQELKRLISEDYQ